MPHPSLQRIAPLFMAMVAATSLLCPTPAHAFQFDLADGEITGALDTTISYGALWRVTGRNAENVALASGGSKSSANFDNGNLNYDDGDLVSSLFKMTNDVDLNYKNFGAFVRVLSFYDYAIENKDFDPLRADERVIGNRLGRDVEVFDAYVRATFKPAGRNLNVRIGQQVVSWGESTFIPNGINVINPVDVAKLRAPGAELKEAFLPVNMLFLSSDITDHISVEVFNQFSYEKTRLEPNGSFFSTNDFASPGATQVIRGSGSLNEAQANATTRYISRTPDKDPRDSNQYGIAIRILAPFLNDTEFGLYFVNYHSRTPLVGGTTGTLVAGTTPIVLATGVSDATYYNEYPENIRLYGLSFNTQGPFGMALQGEYSYRPNQPLQLAAPDLLAELLLNGCANTNTGVGPDNCTFTGGTASPLPAGTEAAGFKRVKFHQLQMTATKSFGPQLMANQLVAIVEAGYTYMDLPEGVPFNGPGVDFGSGPTGRPGPLSGAAANGTSPVQNGLASKTSYGYRTVFRADYLNALGPINLSPRLAWAHDLHGTSPTFNHAVTAITLGLGASYQQNWQADVSYTNFSGGESYPGTLTAGNQAVRSTNNPLSDRDFVAASVSYSF